MQPSSRTICKYEIQSSRIKYLIKAGQPNNTASQAGQSANNTASQAGQSANNTASQAGQSLKSRTIISRH